MNPGDGRPPGHKPFEGGPPLPPGTWAIAWSRAIWLASYGDPGA